MKNFRQNGLLIFIGLLITFLYGLDGLYIGLFASEEVLSQYPWGTELGWSYENKTNYMLFGIMISLVGWLPLLFAWLAQYLENRFEQGKKE